MEPILRCWGTGFWIAAATSGQKRSNDPEYGHQEASGASNASFRIDPESPRNVSLKSIQECPNCLVSGDIRMVSTKRLFPTGECWCGCGAETATGSFFLAAHDGAAESAAISDESGGVPRFLIQYGSGPEAKNPRREVDRWRSKGKRGGDAS